MLSEVGVHRGVASRTRAQHILAATRGIGSNNRAILPGLGDSCVRSFQPTVALDRASIGSAVSACRSIRPTLGNQITSASCANCTTEFRHIRHFIFLYYLELFCGVIWLSA